MELNQATCKQAWLSKDARFDGKFFIGVKTTGIYCRPVCPVKLPSFKNVTFFKTAAQAGANGYRPCLRCRPETSPGTPVWSGTSSTVSRALRLIADGDLDEKDLAAFAGRLGISERHLNRLFNQHLGASPIAVVQTHRLHSAKRLIDETTLPMTQVAMSSGYSSLRRFNDHIKQTYGLTPSQLRKVKSTKRQALHRDSYVFKLPYRPPYNWQYLLDFLSKRATPGVENVVDDNYTRSIGTPTAPGSIRVSCDPDKYQLICEIQLSTPADLFIVIEKVKRIFDLGADPQIILTGLKTDKTLWSIVKKNPGMRVPGAWDGFEIAVRAIVGQQISVVGATTVMGKIVQQYGNKLPQKSATEFLFPTPEILAKLDIESLPMPKARAATIARVAQAVAAGKLNFNNNQQPEQMIKQLLSIKGIGPWTAQYIAMRALAHPDALLEGDLVLEKKAAQLYAKGDRIKTAKLLEYAENWRPWRAYAAMHIWNLT